MCRTESEKREKKQQKKLNRGWGKEIRVLPGSGGKPSDRKKGRIDPRRVGRN